MKKLGIIIFARTSSKRFPNKVIKKFLDKTLLEIVIIRTQLGAGKIPIIVNTSNEYSDNQIVKICKKKKIKYFRGDLNNVFKRTISCCKLFNLDAFVRVCADRPILDFKMMKKMIKIYLKKNYQIVTNQFPKEAPSGLACEIADTKIFFDLKKKIKNREKEHIFDYFYKNSKYYSILNIKDNFFSKIKKYNFSINTKKDYKKFKEVLVSNKLINYETKKIIRIMTR